MHIWAIANQKGGVSKTTSTVTLSGLLAARGFRTLMIDMDPHGSLTSYFGLDPDSINGSVYTLFNQTSATNSPPIYPTRFDNLSLLPSSTALATLDKQLGAKNGMGLVIVKTLLNIKDKYDYVLIDCPPMLGVLMVNALAACNHLIMPVQAEFLALKGLERMMRTVSMIINSQKSQLSYTIVPSMYDQRIKASLHCLKILKEKYPAALWDGVIPVDSKFKEASRLGTPLSLMMPRSRGAIAYNTLLDYILTNTESETRVAV